MEVLKMNRYSVLYGKREEGFQLPGDCKVNFVNAKPTKAIVDYKDEIIKALASPINSQSFYNKIGRAHV